MDLQEHWRITTRLLERALDLERSRLSTDQADHIDAFLEANELGLAHDQLIDALGDVDLEPLPATADLLAQAARRMGHAR